MSAVGDFKGIPGEVRYESGFRAGVGIVIGLLHIHKSDYEFQSKDRKRHSLGRACAGEKVRLIEKIIKELETWI